MHKTSHVYKKFREGPHPEGCDVELCCLNYLKILMVRVGSSKNSEFLKDPTSPSNIDVDSLP